MAKEIAFLDTTGNTCYVTLKNSVGQWYNTAGAAFEAFNAANWTDYDIPATEYGSSGEYAADMPSVTAGIYNVTARRRAGGSPAQSDLPVDVGTIEWNGAIVPSLYGEIATTNSNVVLNGIAIDNLANGTSGVRLLDGVTHGGSTATLRLGTSGSTPAFYVTNDVGTAVSFESTASSGLGGNGFLVIGSRFEPGFYALAAGAAPGALYEGGDVQPGFKTQGGSNGGPGTYYIAGGVGNATGFEIAATGSAASIELTSGTGPGITENAVDYLSRIAIVWGSSVIGNSRTRDYFLQGGTNKIAFDVPSAGQFTIYGTDDTTVLKTGTYTTAAGNPVTVIDPA